MKAKSRLEQIECDYKQQLDRAMERIADAQKKEVDLREQINAIQKEAEEEYVKNTARLDEEQTRLRNQVNTTLIVSYGLFVVE